MPKKETLRMYNLTDAELSQFADRYHTLALRDMAELAAFGVDNTTVTELAAAKAAFKEFPTDIELESEKMITTERKNALAMELKQAIRGVMVRAKDAYGLDSAKYRRFGGENLDRISDAELPPTGRRIARVASTSMADLASRGLTPEMVAAIVTKVTEYDAALDAQDDAIRTRDIRTEERRIAGNALYQVITKLSTYGKEIWRTRDEARYNDYVLYGAAADSDPLVPTPPPSA